MPPGMWASLSEAEIRDINLCNKHKQAYGPINANRKSINNDYMNHAFNTTDATKKKQPNKIIRTSKPTTTTSKITATATATATTTNEYRHVLNKLAAPDIGHGHGHAAPERSYTPSDYEVPYYMSSGQILPADDQAAIDNLIQAMSLSLERETKLKTAKVVSNVEAGDRFGGAAKVKTKESCYETFIPLFAKSPWEEQVLGSQVLAAAALAAAASEKVASEKATVYRVVDRAELAADLLREWDRQQADEEITDTYEMVAKPTDSDSDATNSKNGKTNNKKKDKKYQLADSEDDVTGAQIMIDYDEIVVVETISSADVAAGFEMVERVGGGEEGVKGVVGQDVKEGQRGKSKVAEPRVKEKLEAFPEFDDDFANEMLDHPEEFYGYY